MKKFYLAITAMIIAFAGNAQLFNQNFQSSTSLGSYASVTPTNAQFNEIYDGDAGTNMVVSINSVAGANTLRYVRSGAATGGYTRSTDFTKQPQVFTFSFDITVSGNLATNNASGSAAWYFGNNFANGGAAPSTTGGGNLTYSYFQLDLDDNFPSDRARFRSPNGSTSNYFNINTTQSVYFIANNSGVDITYTGPDGSSETLGNDEWDLWLGNSLELDDENVNGGSEVISDMKFLFNGSNGTIDLDNMVVDEYSDFGSFFYQNFPSNVLGDYDAGNPDNGEFNEFVDNGAGVTISFPGTAGNYGLQFVRTLSTNQGGFTRTTNFSGSTSSTLMFQFDLNVSNITTDATGGAGFYFGDGLPTGANLPSTSGAGREVHSYFLMNFATAAGGSYSFRNGENSTNSASFSATSGVQRMLFVMNSNGSAISYTSPAGLIETLAAESWDLWAGTTKVFNDQVVGATGQDEPLNEMKFYWNAGGATILMDNMLVNPVPVANTTVAPEIVSNTFNPRFIAKWTESSPISYITGYRLDVATNNFPVGSTTYVPGFQDLYVADATTLSALVTGVSTLNTHYIRVRPVYQIGLNEVQGNFSNTITLSSAIFLPVTLTSFTGSVVNKAGELKWVSESEVNNSHYEIERSSDGTNFASVGNVNSKNSATGATYAFRDGSIAEGKNYYRLKMVDLDGKFEYSHVIMLTYAGGMRTMSAYPNPTVGNVTVQFSKAGNGASMKVISLEGRVMQQMSVPANATQLRLNMANYVPGIYTIVYNNNGEQFVQRIQKH